MSVKLISSHPFVPDLPPPTIVVGDPRIASLFFQIIQHYDSPTSVEIDPAASGDEPIFARDYGVIGLGPRLTRFLPHPIDPIGENGTEYLFQSEFKALLPESSDFFIRNSKESGLGFGFSGEELARAVSYMQEHHLPHHQMRSTVEGGNCFVFQKEDQPLAIVGSHSVALTLLGLEGQEYFALPENRARLQSLIDSIPSPSDEGLRKARNMALFARQKSWSERAEFFATHRGEITPEEDQKILTQLEAERTEPGGTGEYLNLLLAPLSEEDRIRYREEGITWDAKENLAHLVIAEDLMVSLEHIAFIPQKHFHIDMDMFVSPDGEKIYLDEGAANPSVIDALEKIGCRVIVVPGVHTVGTESVNFMNGIFISTPSGPLFVTNGTQNDEQSMQIRNIFVQAIAQSNAEFRVHFFDETQKILTDLQGGIHCLTWEKQNSAAAVPQAAEAESEVSSPKVKRKQHPTDEEAPNSKKSCSILNRV